MAKVSLQASQGNIDGKRSIIDHCKKQSLHSSEKIKKKLKKLRTNNTPLGKNRGSCHWRSDLVTYPDLSLKLQLNCRIWNEIRSPENKVCTTFE